MNIAFMVGALLALFVFAEKMFEDYRIAAIVTFMYSVSPAAVSTTIFIRMYSLLTLFTILLTFCVYELDRSNGKKLFLYPVTMVIVFLGALTQYYFIIYAFFTCLTLLIKMLTRKDVKSSILFSVFSFAGILAMMIVYPAFFAHIFKQTGTGETVTSNALYFKGYIWRGLRLLKYFVVGLPALAIIAFVLVMVICVNQVWISPKRREYLEKLLVFLPMVCTLLVLIVISSCTKRYFYNLMPIAGLFVGLLMYLRKSEKDDYVTIECSCLLVALSVFCIAVIQPDWLYTANKANNESLKSIAESAKAVFISDNINPPLTSELQNLLMFNEVYISENENSAGAKQYLANLDSDSSVVVFISTYPQKRDEWQILDNIRDETGVGSIEYLYSGDFSDVYVINRLKL